MHTVKRERLIELLQEDGEAVPAMVTDALPGTEFVWGSTVVNGQFCTLPITLAENYRTDGFVPPEVFFGVCGGPIPPGDPCLTKTKR